MNLEPGTRLGPYEVVALLGAGGMGEVYKARDTRLDRTVAIKILPTEVAADPDRRARFEREAKTIAGLSHPHICTLYDIGESLPSSLESRVPSPQPRVPVHYLVMEHLAGETLVERLRKGPLPVAQALDISAQIAEALDAAHKHGIVHRDLKPGNVMLTAAGSGRSGAVSAKLLDFGLAKLTGHGERPALVAGATAPTMTAPITERGTILGTLQYMAPEQLEGRDADARTDLWALGAILYEMVTGRRAFEGDSQVSLIGNIMNAEPAGLTTLQPLTPPALERVVKKCLAKSPDDRWDGAHDVADELRWIARSGSSSIAVPSPRSTRRRWLALTGWAAAAVVIAILAALLAARFGVPGIAPAQGAAAKAVAHLDIVLPSDSPFWVDPQAFAPSFALSPDGTVMAYTCARGAGTQLCLRRPDRSQVSPIAGTERGRLPVFSPDGRWVLFCVAGVQSCEAGGAIKKLSVVDGRVDTLGTVPERLPFLMTLEWSTGNRILLSGFGGIWTMPASGGAAEPLLLADRARGEYFFALPALLPDGQRMIFTVTRHERGQSLSEARVLTVATGEQRVVLKDAFDVRYLHTGHLLYQQGLTNQQGVSAGLLMVAPFDPSRLAVGPSVMVADPIRQTGPWLAFAVSQSGALLYLPYEADRVLTWVDRQQRAVPALQVKGSWGAVSLSPNGRRVAVEAAGARWPPGIAVVDLERGISTPLTSAGRNPLWTRDGTRIAFTAPRSDRILWQSSDGSGTPETLHTTIMENIGSWSPQGRLAFTKSDQATRSEIWTLSNEGPSWVPRRYLPAAGSASADSSTPRFSPDGRWVAYHGNESGTWEVYVRAYPGADQRTQISIGGGHDAVWSADGRELFYRNGDQFHAVPIATTPRFSAGSPRLLFTGPYLDSGPLNSSNYDVSPDGQRFLVVRVGDEERAPRRFHLVQNWFEELKAKVPVNGKAK
jgi:serine/threonine-protein kinase